MGIFPMMSTFHQPRGQEKRNFHSLRRRGSVWLGRGLWRLAFLLLAMGGTFLKYGFIGPGEMRRIWKCADLLEHWAERLGFR
jgi:hypothetical protein